MDRSVGFVSVPVSAGKRDLLQQLAGARGRVRIEHVEEALAAGIVVARRDQHDPAVRVRLDERRRVVDVAQVRVGELPEHLSGSGGFGVASTPTGGGGAIGVVTSSAIDGAAAGAEPADEHRPPVVAGLRRRGRVGVREIDVPYARGRVHVELVRIERDAAAAERERAELERGGRRVRGVVRVAAAEHRLRNVRPRFLAAVRRVVDDRVQHPVVAAHVHHRRASGLRRLERVVAGIRRARRLRCRRRDALGAPTGTAAE